MPTPLQKFQLRFSTVSTVGTKVRKSQRTSTQGREFHVIRTGGVETAEDLHESLQAGASLVEWYTGYFENFSAYGYDTYRQVLQGYLSDFAGAAVPV